MENDAAGALPAPNFTNGIALGTFAGMIPVATFNAAVKTEAHANPTAIPGKEFYVLCVFAIFKTVTTTACAEELPCFHIDGGPLETLA